MRATYQEFEQRVKLLRQRGIRVREVACVGAPRTLLCIELGAADAQAIALSAGVHGDEPAGPWALLALLEDDALDPRYSYRIFPCTNPTGYERGTRESVDGLDVNRTFGRGGQSPEAKAIITANRDRTFELAIDLHEDCDASGFYCYDYTSESISDGVVAEIEHAGHALQSFDDGYDLGFALPPGTVSYQPGIVRPDPVAEAAALGALTYTLLLGRRAARRTMTFETPLTAPWEQRLAMQYVAVTAAIAAVSQASG